MLKFKVNNYITLSLQDGATVIYVNNEEFIQCKSLLINILANNAQVYNDIGSIDEVVGISQPGKLMISPETEFWGHCSNLHAWAEYEYDARLIHSNLAFPLLKRLTEVGDPKALEVFKLEILRRFNEGSSMTRDYLVVNNYIDYLIEEDIRIMIPVKEVFALEQLEEHLQISFLLEYELQGITSGGGDYYYLEDYCITGLKIRTPIMEVMPQKIEEFRRLRFLNLSNNHIVYLPEVIGNLMNIEVLDLGFNNIQQIPKSLKELRRLRILDLRENNLTRMPETIRDIGALEILYLSGNPINVFPEKFGDLERYEEDMYVKRGLNKNEYFVNGYT